MGDLARQRYGVLLVCALSLLAVQGMVPPGGGQRVVVTALAGASLILALHAAGVRPSVLVAAGTGAAAGLAFALVAALSGGIGQGATQALNAGLLLFGPPAVGLGIVRSLRATRRVGVEAVMGVLSLYVLLGMLFAFVYGAIDRLASDPFFAGDPAAGASVFLYFSFTTLTTVGYGDFTAGGDVGRTLAVFEMLLGQIYLVTIVSLIVGNLGRPAAAYRTERA